MHSTENIDDGYFGSGNLITRSIKKHGIEKHIEEILEYLPDRKSLALREKEIINKELLEDKSCMNLKVGGDGGWAKCSDPILRAELSQVTMRIRRKDPEWVAKYHSTMSAALKGKQSWLGKNHSEKTKKKLRDSMKGLQDGEKNSQFGTCWVIKADIKPFKIKKEQLNEYIQNGYSRGRK